MAEQEREPGKGESMPLPQEVSEGVVGSVDAGTVSGVGPVELDEDDDDA